MLSIFSMKDLLFKFVLLVLCGRGVYAQGTRAPAVRSPPTVRPLGNGAASRSTQQRAKSISQARRGCTIRADPNIERMWTPGCFSRSSRYYGGLMETGCDFAGEARV